MAPMDEPATDTSSGGYGYSEDEEDSYGWRTPPKQSRPTDMLRRARAYAVQQPKQLLAVAVAALVLLLLWWSSLPPPDPWRRDHKWEVGLRPPPAPQSRLATTGQGRRGERRVAGVAELLTPQAPADSFYDSLRPELRYLTCDSWSGLTGQFFSALSLIHLASLTQRVAIIPSWRDDGHYGSVITRMSTLFDLERFRRDTGMLFVEWDDIRPNRNQRDLPTEELGCFKASWFENALTFGDHNVHQSVWDVPRPGEATVWSYESFTLYDYESRSRLEGARRLSNETGVALPRNIAEETAEKGLLCYTNIWDLQHAGEGLKEGPMVPLLAESLRGVHPEWFTVGRYIDFAPAIWDVALACAHRTLNRKKLPPLLTVHIRRGDFLDLCAAKTDCTPTLDAYIPKVNALLQRLPRHTQVLVTSDETTDLAFLSGIDALGWHRVDHAALGTAARLEELFGASSRWADSAVDQALLSLGSSFVGTEGSQVSEISALRVRSWNEGSTVMVPRPV